MYLKKKWCKSRGTRASGFFFRNSTVPLLSRHRSRDVRPKSPNRTHTAPMERHTPCATCTANSHDTSQTFTRGPITNRDPLQISVSDITYGLIQPYRLLIRPALHVFSRVGAKFYKLEWLNSNLVDFVSINFYQDF